jgi:uncharacterized membrane protein
MTNFLSFGIHGKANHSGGVAESVEHLSIFLTDLLSKPPGEMVSTLLPGLTSLPNIHPLLVHFPIAFFFAFFVFDTYGAFSYKNKWREAASRFLYLGTWSSLATVGAGIVAASTIAHGYQVHGVMERHEQIGFSILGLSLLLSIWRLNLKSLVCDIANSFFMMLSTLLIGLVIMGADLGGLMVYRYGVAIAGVAQDSHDHANPNKPIATTTTSQTSDGNVANSNTEAPTTHTKSQETTNGQVKK